MVIHRMFDAVVKNHPEKTAALVQRDGEWQELSFQAMREDAIRIASFLRESGINKQDRVCLAAENCPEWSVAYLGIMYAGGICVPLDARSGSAEMDRLICDSQARAVFCSASIFSERIHGKIAAAVDRYIIIGHLAVLPDHCLSYAQVMRTSIDASGLPDVQAEDTASLIYTSGTTGKPKGVELSHGNICANFASLEKLQLCFSSDNFIALLPFHHTYPFMATMMLPLLLGAGITYAPPGFNPGDLSALIKGKKVTVMVAVPQLLALIHHAMASRIPFQSAVLKKLLAPVIQRQVRKKFGPQLRLMVSGGARLDPVIGRDLRCWGLPVVEGYGLTETAPVVSFNPPRRAKYGSVGKPLPDVEIRIHEPDQTGVGEIIVRGPNVMKGYYRQPELTRAVIRDGWFYTGDLGYFDRQGYLFISGRKKEMIVLSSGKNIYPEDLERHFLSSPFIKEICVMARLERTGGRERESLHAVIVPDIDYFRKAGETGFQDKIRWEIEELSRNLPAHEHLMGFTLTQEDLPKTALGKLQRFRIADRYPGRSGSAGEAARDEAPVQEDAAEEGDSETAAKVKKILSERFNRPVFLKHHLEIDLGIDSLTRVEIGMEMQKAFFIKMADGVLSSASTVREMAAEVENQIRMSGDGLTREIHDRETPWEDLLNSGLPDHLIQKVRLHPGAGGWIITVFLWTIAQVLFRVVWLLRIKKISPSADDGPCLITPNHVSYLDGFAVMCGLSLTKALNTYFIGWSGIFERPFLRWANKPARLVSIDTGSNFIESMQLTAYLLANKKTVCIFPEGQRSIDGEVKNFKSGVGILIRELNADAVPVLIEGAFEAWPRTKKFPRPYPVRVTFGKRVSKEGLLNGRSGSPAEEYKMLTDALRQEICNLRSRAVQTEHKK